MNIDKILEYQKLDNEIYKLEQKLEKSDDKKKMQFCLATNKKNVALIANLEKEAEKLLIEYKRVQKNFNDAISNLKRLEKDKEKEVSNEQCAKIVNQLNNISVFLTGIERNIGKLATKINKTLTEREQAKTSNDQAKENYDIHKANFDELEKKLTPQINELKDKLKTLEAGLDPNFVAKYTTKRQDKIFPVIVPLANNSCGRCGMEIPSAQIEKLKANGFLECESCHRIIYFK